MLRALIKSHTLLMSSSVPCNFAKRTLCNKSFVDSIQLILRGGNGGDGFSKYGGIGGKGGDVIVKADAKAKLSDLAGMEMQRMRSTRGQDSKLFQLKGINGEDLVIKCPVGITVYEKVHSKEVKLGVLNEDGSVVVAARGGAGGNTDTNWFGRPGQTCTLRLDLQLIADVGLVGFPNAGKSSFLAAVSSAKPKIASYPFTTLRPLVGHMTFSLDKRSITVADLPGLIEGSHEDRGLGHNFLKHLTRTKILLFVIDVNGFQMNVYAPHRSPIECLELLIDEIRHYDHDLLLKPCVIVLNKIDTLNKDEETMRIISEIKSTFKGNEESGTPNFASITSISAKKHTNLSLVKNIIRRMLDAKAMESIVLKYKYLEKAVSPPLPHTSF